MPSRCACGAPTLLPNHPYPCKCRDCLADAVLDAHGIDPEDPDSDAAERLLE